MKMTWIDDNRDYDYDYSMTSTNYSMVPDNDEHWKIADVLMAIMMKKVNVDTCSGKDDDGCGDGDDNDVMLYTRWLTVMMMMMMTLIPFRCLSAVINRAILVTSINYTNIGISY